MSSIDSATGFLEDFRAQGAAIADACVRCGDCFRACPMVPPAGLGAADAEDTTAGIVDLITGGFGVQRQRQLHSGLSARCQPAPDGSARPWVCPSTSR
jgi:ferredoxin